MQKEVLYSYKDNRISDYQNKDIAIYDVKLTDDDVKQIKKLTKDSLTFNIPQLNINYCNSFNENYDVTIQYAPITVYDLDKLIGGKIDDNYKMKDQDAQDLYLDQDFQTNPTVSHVDNLRLGSSTGSLNIQECEVELQPQAHTFSLQQQSINSLLNELNYPLKHIPYNDSQRFVLQGDGEVYVTNCNGEVDISKQIYWDTYNGKLRFNYTGVTITLENNTWTLYTNAAGTSYDDGCIGTFPKPTLMLPALINGGTYKYNYVQSWVNRYWSPLDIFGQGNDQHIYVKQLDSYAENKVFYLTNFYFANQLMGLMQTPQEILTFIDEYQYGDIKSYWPQTRYNNYQIDLWMKNNTKLHLKDVCADFILSKLDQNAANYSVTWNPNEGEGQTVSVNTYPVFTKQYTNRSVCLAKEFFLQLWREVYVVTPSLQSNTILYKPESIKYSRILQFTNQNNANGQQWMVIGDKFTEENTYQFKDKLTCVAYYVNSVSFNNYVSLQNTFPLQYMFDEVFEVEALKEMKFILLDENGVVLPRLSEFKVYMQFSDNMNNAAQQKTTNFNRVIGSDTVEQ